MTVRALLHPTSPYAGIDAAGPVGGGRGRGPEEPLLERVIAHFRPPLVIEVGSGGGGTAIQMARILSDLAIPGEVVAIDTWLGGSGADDPDEAMPPPVPSLRPPLYERFLRRVVEAGMEDRVTPLPASPDGGFAILRRLDLMADVIHLASGHGYAALKRDLSRYVQLLNPTGVMIAADAGRLPGAARAAEDFARALDLHAVRQGERIVLSRVEFAPALGLGRTGADEAAQRAA